MSVIRREGNQFVIYPLTDDMKVPQGIAQLTRDTLDERLTPEYRRLRDVPPGLTIVTQDGYTYRSGSRGISEYNQGDTDKAIAQRVREINNGYQEAFGTGLQNIKDKDQFFSLYNQALRDNALNTLAQSELEAQQ